jgi:DNA-binding LacI/PurR family transcriptional regulator
MATIDSISDAKVKHSLIADELRRQIVTNVLAPGSQLPTRSEIVSKYQVSSVTVQKALDRLIQDGFVDATRRKGSFVVANPPHQCRYALVFQEGAPAKGHTSRYLTALTGESERIRARDREVAVYYRVDGYADNPDYQRLLYDVRARRVAGMIFPYGLGPLAQSPILQPDANGPQSVVVVAPGQQFAGIPTVDLDARTFVAKALDYLAQRGRKRIAVLSGQAPSAPFHTYMAEGIAERRLTMRPYWNQYASILDPETARNCAHLMMMPVMDNGKLERPDGLIIADDNLVENASIGLLASGVKVGEEVDVISHCNFPWPTPSILPVKRLGYDIRELLLVCIDLVDNQRRGEAPPAMTRIAAKFEDEVRRES